MSEHIVAFHNVVKRYGEVTALAGLCFTVPPRGCLGLLGPNGAGKTTAIKSLLSLTPINSGSIENKAQRVGYLPQHPAVFNWMSAGEMLRFVGTAAGLAGKPLAEAENQWLERLGLGKARRRMILGFSGGMKQRLGIAAALLTNPDVLVLDEPVSALDPVGRHEILALLNELKSDRCIIMSTHILDDAERVCDEVVIMHEGRAVLQKNMIELGAGVALRYDIELIGDQAAISRAGEQLGKQPFVAGSRTEGTILAVTLKDYTDVPELLRILAALDNVRVQRVEQNKATLEDVFLQVVSAQ